MTVTYRSASGWWPNLVTLTCDRCGLSWIVDLNNARWTAASFISKQKVQHEEGCSS